MRARFHRGTATATKQCSLQYTRLRRYADLPTALSLLRIPTSTNLGFSITIMATAEGCVSLVNNTNVLLKNNEGSERYGSTPRVLTTEVEHSSIRKYCEHLSDVGVEVQYLSVDRAGRL